MEELQYKSRLLLDKYLMQSVLPTFKMMYAMVLFWIDSFAGYTGINAIFQVIYNNKINSNLNSIPCS